MYELIYCLKKKKKKKGKNNNNNNNYERKSDSNQRIDQAADNCLCQV